MFWDILKQNFGAQLQADYPSPSFHCFPSSAVEWSLRQYNYRCYTSHNYRFSSLEGLSNYDITAFFFVRDPISRYLSSYFFARGLEKINPSHPSKRLCVEKYFEFLLSENKNTLTPLDVSQYAFLLGDTPNVEFKEVLRNKSFDLQIFPTERFDDAMLCLERLYPADFKDCSYYRRVNQSIWDQEVTDKVRSLILQLPLIEEDKRLHQYSLTHLDDTLSSVFPSIESLDEARSSYKARCLQKESIPVQGKRSSFVSAMARLLRLR